MFKTTRGLILREVKYKEADRILTVLTEDTGKLTVKARGALRKGSKVGAATQFLVFSELTMFENKGYWTVNEGSTIEEFKGLREDFSALSLGSYFAECVESLSDEDSPSPELLQLILNCLYALSNGLYSKEHIKSAFELRLMCISGYAPELRACAVCGKENPSEPRFSPRNGIIVCRDCKTAEHEANIRLSQETLDAMRYIAEAPPKRLLSFKISEAAEDNLAYAAETYLLTQTERLFPTLSYWKQVK